MAGLEVCVDTIAGVAAAQDGGATRVELCSALSEGGLTPSAGLMSAAAQFRIPCFAMIRPRSGDFLFSGAEVQIMLADIRAAANAGLAGVVLGAQRADGPLDTDILQELVAAAGTMGKTLHRVIDVVPDAMAAVDQAIALGFDRILTSGGAGTAWQGRARIAEMHKHAAGRLSIMPGSGVTPENARDIIAATDVQEVHASCSRSIPAPETLAGLGADSGTRETDAETVAAIVAAVAEV